MAEPVTLAFRLQGMPDRVLSVPEIQLAGPGLEIGMAGSASLKEDGPVQIEIRDLRAILENWQPFCSLAFPEIALSGKPWRTRTRGPVHALTRAATCDGRLRRSLRGCAGLPVCGNCRSP